MSNKGRCIQWLDNTHAKTRGLESRIAELEEAIRKAAKEFQDMRWGYDGDCGSGSIIDELESALKAEGGK